MPEPSSRTAPLPVATRPDWVHHTRSAASFWLSTGTMLALTLVLVLLWPHKWRRAARAISMPEATASYVLLEGSYSVLPGNPLGNPWPGPRGSGIPDREDVVARRLPLPEFTGLDGNNPWVPLRRSAPSNALPNLAARSVAAVLTGLSPVTNGFAMTLSPGLQRSGFQFEIPSNVTTGKSTVARFHIELDDQGEVIHLLAEPSDNLSGMRLLEAAINRGHGLRAGRGEVMVSWGK